MASNPLGVIDRYYPDLNATDRQLADYARANAMDVSRLPIDQVAKELGVSKSTLVRFTQKLGYTGYAAFKQELARHLLSHQDTDENGLPERAIARITETYASYLRRMAESLSDQDMSEVAQLVCDADRILIVGYDRSFNSAAQLSKRLVNVGVRSEALSDLNTIHNVFNLYTAHDLLIVFTVADNARMYASHVRELAENGVHVVCITCTPSLPFKGLCAQYVTLPRISRDPDVVFLDDQALFLVLIEILIDAVAKRMAQDE